jgi:hypothetical protein
MEQQRTGLGGEDMKRGIIKCVLLTYLLFASTAVLLAEVKTEEKSQVKFEGMMGRMMGMFAGKAAKEGLINTVSIKGDRKATISDNTGEIIDLSEQKIYSVDFKKKSYEVITFEEMRRRLQEARDQAAKSVRESKQEKPSSDRQMELDVSLKESGQKRTINGYDCREVVMTITAKEKGKTLEEGGGMVMTSHVWLGPDIPALNEISDFDQRYAKAMGEIFGSADSAQQMAMATAMYPGMKDMIGKMQAQSVNMNGSQILTEMVIETVKTQAQVSQEQNQSQNQTGEASGMPSIRGLGGMLGRGLGRKKEPEGDAGKPKNRATVMTTTHELLKVATGVSDADVAMPAGFKEKK